MREEKRGTAPRGAVRPSGKMPTPRRVFSWLRNLTRLFNLFDRSWRIARLERTFVRKNDYFAKSGKAVNRASYFDQIAAPQCFSQIYRTIGNIDKRTGNHNHSIFIAWLSRFVIFRYLYKPTFRRIADGSYVGNNGYLFAEIVLCGQLITLLDLHKREHIAKLFSIDHQVGFRLGGYRGFRLFIASCFLFNECTLIIRRSIFRTTKQSQHQKRPKHCNRNPSSP